MLTGGGGRAGVTRAPRASAARMEKQSAGACQRAREGEGAATLPPGAARRVLTNRRGRPRVSPPSQVFYAREFIIVDLAQGSEILSAAHEALGFRASGASAPPKSRNAPCFSRDMVGDAVVRNRRRCRVTACDARSRRSRSRRCRASRSVAGRHRLGTRARGLRADAFLGYFRLRHEGDRGWAPQCSCHARSSARLRRARASRSDQISALVRVNLGVAARSIRSASAQLLLVFVLEARARAPACRTGLRARCPR